MGVGSAEDRLQWGHDHMIVEMEYTRAYPITYSVLQWGHDHMIVEIRCPCRQVLRP